MKTRPRSTWLPTTLTVLTLVSLISRASAAPTSGQRCQAAKNMAAGKYESCRQIAEAGFATSANTAKYTATLAKCLKKYRAAWSALEAKAVARGNACPSVGDQAVIQGVIDQHTTSIAAALGGGVLGDCSANLQTCQVTLDAREEGLTTCSGNLTTCTSDLGTCAADLTTCQAAGDAPGRRLQTGQTTCSDVTGTVIACAGTGQDGELQKGLAASYTDNGDGTITDATTGLMWEKLSDDSSIHDKDTPYSWTSAFTKVATLNSTIFAGFDDWRLPNINELQSLVDYDAEDAPLIATAFNTGCESFCTVLDCSCTQRNRYWSSSSSQVAPKNAWYVLFVDGSARPDGLKGAPNFSVRAVRGGS